MKLPPAGSPTAESLIDAALKERNYPANPINAARAGWEAARAALAEPVADEPVARACQYNGGTCNRRSCAHECTAMTLCDTRPAAAPAERGEYPPLPDELRTMRDLGRVAGPDTIERLMRAYVDADRAQRVPLTTPGVKHYCCYAAYCEAGHDKDCPNAHGIGAKP